MTAQGGVWARENEWIKKGYNKLEKGKTENQAQSLVVNEDLIKQMSKQMAQELENTFFGIAVEKRKEQINNIVNWFEI